MCLQSYTHSTIIEIIQQHKKKEKKKKKSEQNDDDDDNIMKLETIEARSIRE